MIYLDCNATTPLDPLALEAMLPYLREQFGNPSSRHEKGTAARKAVDRAREQVAAAVGAQPAQVVFTSSGSEANNLFIKGMAAMRQPAQLAVSAIEHPCVMRPAQDVARGGWALRKIQVNSAGQIDLADLDTALRQPTGLVSVMLANNETGVIQPVAEASARARAHGAWMHTDAVQALGKMSVDFHALGVHALTLSSHKIYGPKGAGALIVDKRIAPHPLVHGGAQEHGLRAGTENVPAIVGFGAACELAVARQSALARQTEALRERLEIGLKNMGAVLFGAEAPRIPNTSYFAFAGLDGETLVVELDHVGFGVASGAACSAMSGAPSATLLAMGVAEELARGAVRVSFGKDNTVADVESFLPALHGVVNRLKHLMAVAV